MSITMLGISVTVGIAGVAGVWLAERQTSTWAAMVVGIPSVLMIAAGTLGAVAVSFALLVPYLR